MKKFGKIFGISALAVATLTAGALGLSGCGDKAKSEKLTMDDVRAYVTSEEVVSTFDGIKVTGASSLQESMVLYMLKDGENLIIKSSQNTGTLEVNAYYPGDGYLYQEYLYLDDTREDEKIKQTDEALIEGNCSLYESMFADYSSAEGIFTSVLNEGAIRNLTKTTQGNKIIFTIEVSSTATTPGEESGAGNEGETGIEESYSGSIKLEYVDDVIQKVVADGIRVEGGEAFTSTMTIERITEIDFPSFDDFVEEA